MKKYAMLIIFGLFVIAGCMANKVTITAANTTQPVLLGDEISVGQKYFEKQSYLEKKSDFSIPVKNTYMIVTTGYTTATTTKKEGSNKIDKELSQLRTDTLDVSNVIKVEEVRFSVKMGYWLFVLYSGVNAVLDGALYQM